MANIINTKSDFFNDLIAEQGKGLIGSIAFGVAKKLKSDREWRKLFLDSGKEFVDSEESAGCIIDELSDVLSKKSMKDLAKEVRNDPGYGIENKILAFLVRLMIKHNIPHDRALAYSQKLLTIILENIMEQYPERYDRYLLSSLRDSCLLSSQNIREKIEEISAQLKEYKDRGLNILSSDNIDQHLHEISTLQYFGIGFFEVDDNQFREKLSLYKNEERLYVKCKCKEEAIYCIVNELLYQKEERPIFVVKNEESWDALRDINNTGNIYIPDFWADEIIAIPNNTNIFVMQENIPLFSKDYIELRPRTIRTIINCLGRAGMDLSEASGFASKNHGLFTLMKRELIKGVCQKKPEWLDIIPSQILKTCLLVCRWKENEGDKLVIEELSGYKYDDFISEIKKYSKGDDPFVVITSRYGEKSYSLASVEDSWLYSSVSVEEEIWKKFVDIFTFVMMQNENLLSYEDVFKKTTAQIQGEKLDWSGAIRLGMTHALITKSYCIGDENCQPIIDNLVRSILSTITDEQGWRYISNYFKELCELSPDVIISRLNKEFKEPTGMIQLFEEKSEDFMWANHYYINILWGLEQFLLQNEYARQAFDILLRLDNLNIEYRANSPREIIRTVLCVWGNFSAFNSSEDKIFAAKKTFELNKNAWDIIYSVLPNNQQTIVGELSKPLYRDFVSTRRVSNKEYTSVFEEYFSLLVKNVMLDPKRWKKLLESANQLNEDSVAKLISSLLTSLKLMEEENQIKIKDSIREIIYKNRVFNNASWAMNEDVIIQYENLLKDINIEIPEYEYAHYFNYLEMEFPLIHPFVHGEEDYLSKNGEKAEELIRKKTLEFRKNKLDLSVLASCCALREGMEDGRFVQSYLGRFLGLYWDAKGFDKKVFSILLQSQKSGKFACDYYGNVCNKNYKHFEDALAIARAGECDVSVIVDLYQTESKFSVDKPAIYQADDSVKKEFWTRYRFGYFKDVETALNECQKYGSCSSYIRLLYFLNEKNHFDSEFVFNHIKIIPSLVELDIDRMEGYYLTHILSHIQDEYIKDEKKRIQIALVEFLFSPILEWSDMKCFQFDVKTRPDSFVDMLSVIYKTDDGSISEFAENNKEFWNYYYRLYDKMKFCPAEENGCVDEKKLIAWISRFDELLKKNKQISIRGMVLGRLFAHSPAGSDGFYPCEAVRKEIEKNDDPSILFEYQISVKNDRGVHYATEGRDELLLSESYKQNAEYLSIKYPKTASIYYSLADDYKKQSNEERRHAEDAF